MREINLLESFPKSQRKIEKGWRTDENKRTAQLFSKEFFDGDRINGYGGYYYDGRWKGVVNKLKELYKINSESSVLDIGCAKGFLLYDLQNMIPGIKTAGIDISDYAINHAMDGLTKYSLKQGINDIESIKLEKVAKGKVLPSMIIGSAEKLPWANHTFDVVLSINTAHNLPLERCKNAIREMIRVCKPNGNKFIQLDSWRNPEEQERMKAWSITAETMMSDKEWLELLEECGYDGDYFWTTV